MVAATKEIFHTQQVFRTLLDCMARPGKIGTIESWYTNVQNNMSPYLVSVLLTLLDQEVTFHVYGENADQVTFLQVLTMAKEESLEHCDYLVIKGLNQADFSLLKNGTLNFPDQSATVICQVESITMDKVSASEVEETGTRERDANTLEICFKLQGPGIKTENQCYVQGLREENVTAWRECNADFPLGIDIILVDQQGRLCCLPRSVRWNWEVL